MKFTNLLLAELERKAVWDPQETLNMPRKQRATGSRMKLELSQSRI